MQKAITLISNKHERIQSEDSIQEQIDQIVEIFTVANGILKLKDLSICQEELLLGIFSQANALI